MHRLGHLGVRRRLDRHGLLLDAAVLPRRLLVEGALLELLLVELDVLALEEGPAPAVELDQEGRDEADDGQTDRQAERPVGHQVGEVLAGETVAVAVVELVGVGPPVVVDTQREVDGHEEHAEHEAGRGQLVTVDLDHAVQQQRAHQDDGRHHQDGVEVEVEQHGNTTPKSQHPRETGVDDCSHHSKGTSCLMGGSYNITAICTHKIYTDFMISILYTKTLIKSMPSGQMYVRRSQFYLQPNH